MAFKCSTQKQSANLGRRRLPQANTADGGLRGAECLGAEALLQLLKNYARAADRKTAITVGACGRCASLQGTGCARLQVLLIRHSRGMYGGGWAPSRDAFR